MAENGVPPPRAALGMAVAVLLMLLGCVRATLSPRIVVVPHDAQPGTLVHKLHLCGVKLKDASFSEYFSLMHDGSLITVGNISSKIDKPVTLEVYDNLLPDVHLETLQLRVLNTRGLLRFPSDYAGRVQENSAVGTPVTGLEFVNAEAKEQHSKVAYEIVSGNTNKVFALKKAKRAGNTGVAVVVAGGVDRETVARHNLTIQALYADGSDHTKTVATVTVGDVNDNAPRFALPLHSVSLSTDVASMTRVVRVVATDADEAQRLTYSMWPDDPFFFVAPLTGEIFVACGVDEGDYNLTVYATDDGAPPLTSSPPTTVTVAVRRPHAHVQRVMDIVNTEPERARVRRRAGRTFDVPENKTGVIGTLQRWEEGERFQLEEEDEFVTVDPNTGDISLKFGKQFDYEEQTVHTFNVIITGGVSDTQKVVINVLDVNDERPEFVNKPRPFQTVVSPNAPQGELVYVLDARDKDKDADIIYKIELDLSGEKAFEVDERTGMVRTQRDGPFQVGRDYVLRVRALDKNGIPGTQESAMETLSIVVGNRPPQFYEVDYEAPVNEEEKSDVRVVRVQAKSFSNKPIKYKVTTEVGQPSDAFAVRQPESGWVFLLKRLDYDDFSQPKTYRLQVHAEEEGSGGLSSSTLLTVKVVDVNDNPPVFNLPEYVKENIDENLPAGSMILAVTATDADSYQNGKITYELSDTQNFTIRNEDGAILSKRKLDYEIPGHKYEFQVMASDSGTPSKSSPAVVRIFMKNQNDEAPRFSQSVYITNVAEDAKPGALVTTLNAVDPDGDKVTYQFKDGQLESREFKIDPQTGVLRLKDSDVSLSEPYYTLNVTAKDDGSCCAGDSPEHFSEALVTVRVIDVNNNKPVFPNCTLYRPKVPENSPAGTFVLQVTATDDDTGDNGRVRYKIESRDTVAQEPFRIDEDTGIITTRIPFDREEKNHRQITVTATDRAPRQLIGVCTFVVDITDDNDNEPKFSSTEYDTPVPERSEVGRSFLRVAAQDVDVGQNAEIGYSLIDTSGFFSINPQTGWIYVKRPLTQVKEVQAIAVATDKGVPARSSNVKIRIVITDRTGSNPPQWVGAPYPPVFISENIPVGSEVATIKARSDYFADPRLLYDIVPGSTREKNSEHHFIMRPDFKDENQAHIVVIRPLDYEKMAVFNLTIRAKNNAQVQLSNVTYLIINLQDENDNAPQFTLDPYPASVPEDSPIGTSVIQVKAEDIDSLGPNSHVIYEIMRDGPTDEGRAFSIDSESGILRTAEEFDREKKQLYLIRVLAKDRAPSTWPNRQGSPNEGGAYVRVMVEDVNDNVPFFSKKLFEAEVNEDAPKGTIVIEVTAKDRDEVTHLRYQLTTGNIGGVFDVNNETGEIRVQGELDYDEGIQIYNLTLVASDGKNENETLIRIYVRDVNDNRPIFLTPQYEANIPEEMKEGLPKKILQVSANDKDRAPPDDIRYSLRGQGQATGVFTINPQTGEIFINKPLDRDPPAGQELFTLLTLATDDKGRGNYGYADVYIHLTDINDNAPRFDGNFEGLVDENTAAGKSVMRMTAVDYDTGENAKLTYRITENVIDDATQYNIFTIDPKSGLITTRVGNLDREKIDHYKIKVEAKDAGGLTGTGIATINVGDQNDEKPEFVTKVYKATIAENLPKGTSVLSVSASDKDKDSRLRYIIVDEVGQKFFNIQDDPDTNSAVLQIAKDPTETGKAANGLDYEDLKQHFMNLTIKVNDDKESHYDFAFVEITLTDYNDNPPDFKIKHQSKRLKEDVQPGTSLVKVEATDADSEENGKFRYEIDRAVDSDPEELFTIDEKGMVYVNKTLDREKVDTHYVRILAIDEAYPYNTGTTRLTVNVDDVNDNFPQFAEDYNLIIYENEPPFQDMSPLVSATDPDIGGEPFKFWSPPPRDNPTKDQFEVHFIERGGKNRYGAARVRTLMTFDREVTKQFKVPIVMADSGNPQMTGTNTLTITIGDKNDNPHYAGIKDIFVFNYKNNMPETVIGTVYAEDKDDWDFSDKEFTFAEGVPTYFKLGNNSGDVIIRNNTPAGKYSFKVNVYDRVFSKNVVSTVNVEVKGIWDDAVFNSGSVRITGMTGEEFIAVDKDGNSKYALFQKEVAKVTGALVENVEVFSIMDRPETKGKPREVDIRFAAHGSPYYKAVKLDGAVEANLIEVERNVGINITMVRIDECLREFCEGGCSNRLEAFQTPTLVNSNKTSLVVVTTTVTAECVCLATDFRSVETCNSASAIGCRNGGTCHDSPNGYYCTCPQGFDGPQCQQTTRSFHGGGWAWFEPLKQCNKSRVSFEFMTEQADALLLYNGPMRARDGSERDFIVVELVNGKPRVTIDFGSGPLTLYVGKAENLGDEEWHRLDVVLEDKKVTFVVDRCRMIKMTESGNYDQSSCMATGIMPGRNKFLNVNTPLQLGGISNTDVGQPKMKFEKSFTGCIKNVVQDGRMYDIGNPGSSQSSSPGCARTDGVCGINKVTPRCLHGTCLGSVHSAHCRCEPGYYGRSCELEAQPRSFEDNSFVHLQLKKLPLSEQKSRIELMFRTNKPDGTLFRATGAARFDYMSLEIEAKKLHFRYNLGSVTHELTLTHVNVTDGQWHAALVERYGSDVFMSLDGGGGRRQNETLGLREHHRLIEVDQQEIYIGAAASITSVTVQSVRVYNIPSPQKDFVGCIKDVRYEEYALSLHMENQYSKIMREENVIDGCADGNECLAFPTCSLPAHVCIDMWRRAECHCPGGYLQDERGDCHDINECIISVSNMCQNSGVCVNLPGDYHCRCIDGWEGKNCNYRREEVALDLSKGALAAILVCLLLLLILVLVFVMYNRRRTKEKYPYDIDPDDDIRENIINYQDEGGGEDDQDAYDISKLRKPADSDAPGSNQASKPNHHRPPTTVPPLESARPVRKAHPQYPPGEHPDIEDFIKNRKDEADDDPGAPPRDDVRNYAYEGCGSTAGSLSSLASGTDDEDLDFDRLNNWGPRFNKLAEMYGGEED